MLVAASFGAGAILATTDSRVAIIVRVAGFLGDAVGAGAVRLADAIVLLVAVIVVAALAAHLVATDVAVAAAVAVAADGAAGTGRLAGAGRSVDLAGLAGFALAGFGRVDTFALGAGPGRASGGGTILIGAAFLANVVATHRVAATAIERAAATVGVLSALAREILPAGLGCAAGRVEANLPGVAACVVATDAAGAAVLVGAAVARDALVLAANVAFRTAKALAAALALALGRAGASGAGDLARFARIAGVGVGFVETLFFEARPDRAAAARATAIQFAAAFIGERSAETGEIGFAGEGGATRVLLANVTRGAARVVAADTAVAAIQIDTAFAGDATVAATDFAVETAFAIAADAAVTGRDAGGR